VLRGEDALQGEVLPHLRSVAGLTAKALSLALGLEDSAVATWERRNTRIARPTAFMVAAILYRRLCVDAGSFLDKVRDLFLAAVDVPAPTKRRRKPKNAA
jgi:transcriptional regulator with XRE-family HTH domain